MGACFSSRNTQETPAPIQLNRNQTISRKSESENKLYDKIYVLSADFGIVKDYRDETEKFAREKQIRFCKLNLKEKHCIQKLSGEKNSLLIVFEEVSHQNRLSDIVKNLNQQINLSGIIFSIFLIGSIQSITTGNELRIKLMTLGAKEHQKVKLKIHPSPKGTQSIISSVIGFFVTSDTAVRINKTTEDFFAKFKEHFESPTNKGVYSGYEIMQWIKSEIKREGKDEELDDATAIGYGQSLIRYNIIRHTERAKPFLNSTKVMYEIVYENSGKPKYSPPQEWNY